MKLCIILVAFAIHISIQGEGFLAGTVVNTPCGCKTIESLQIQDPITSLHNNSVKTTEIATIKHVLLKSYLEIAVGNEIINVALDHKFYLPIKNKWVEAQQLINGDVLLCAHNQTIQIDTIEFIDHAVIAYSLSVNKYHTFFISSHNILVHNFAFPLVSWAIGESFVWGPSLLGIGCGLVKGLIVWIFNKNNHSNSTSIINDNDYQINHTIDYKGLTNKEARKQAAEWGYVEDKNPPFNSHGNPAFRKGKIWITPDADGHNGGVWKKFNNKKRLATLDKDSNPIKD